MTRMRILKTTLLVVASLAWQFQPAQADPLVYTFTGMGAGQIVSGGSTTTFGTVDNPATFTITAYGDTNNVMNASSDPNNPSVVSLALSSPSISIVTQNGTINTNIITGLVLYDVQATGQIELGSPTLSTKIFGESGAVFDGYNLGFLGLTPGTPLANDTTTSVRTSLGTLTFNNGVTMIAYSAVPEPSSLAMLGIASVGLAVLARRRHRRASGLA